MLSLYRYSTIQLYVWCMAIPPDIQTFYDQLDAAGTDAKVVVAGLSEEQGAWRPAPGSWGVAECLEHMAVSNQVYLEAMDKAASLARKAGRMRRGPAKPGWLGRLFAGQLEPPVKARMKAPKKIHPRASPPLEEVSARFFASHAQIREFLRLNADLDLNGTRFPNPFIPGLRFSLASGVNILLAHERRHLWQARRVIRQQLEAQATKAM
jgi:hypothetical protein